MKFLLLLMVVSYSNQVTDIEIKEFETMEQCDEVGHILAEMEDLTINGRGIGYPKTEPDGEPNTFSYKCVRLAS